MLLSFHPNLIAMGALAFVSFLCCIGWRLSPNVPNNESKLNQRQIIGILFALSGILLALCGLYLASYAVYRTLLTSLFYVMECVSFFFWFYDPVLLLCSQWRRGYRPVPPHTPTPDKMNRFAIIGCAHNEEVVIGQLIASIFKTDYDKELYDVFIICDNCTDHTADVVRAAGAHAMERFDSQNKGKAYALDWMFQQLKEWEQQGVCYDAYVILDADNLISYRFLRAMNRSLNEGHDILQAYLGCKNPDDSWIARCYSIAYWISNVSYQKTHLRLGLSAQMGGTGMVFRPNVLDEVGWHTDSLTEDLLITTRYVLEKNRSAYWVHDARIYDEKPLKLRLSLRQRTRWMQGHMQTMEMYWGSLIAKGIRHRSAKCLDVAFYLMRPLLNLCIFTSFSIRWLVWFLLPNSFLAELRTIMTLPLAIALLLANATMQCLVLFRENRARYIPWMPLQFVFSLTWYPAIFRGLIKRNEKHWVSTIHTRALSIEETDKNFMTPEEVSRMRGGRRERSLSPARPPSV